MATRQPTWVAVNYEIGTDAASPAWNGENTPKTIAAGSNFRLRVRVGETNDATTNNVGSWTLQFAVNGGTFTTVGAATGVKYVDSTHITDGATGFTGRLSDIATALTYQSAWNEYDENNAVASQTWNDEECEYEYSLNFNSVTATQAITFRMVSPQSTNITFTNVPTVYVLATLEPSRYDNTSTFYAATVTVGSPQTITQASRFDNAASFYAPAVHLTLTQASRFNGSQSFYAAAVSMPRTYAEAFTASGPQGVPQQPYGSFTGKAGTGAQALTQASRFDHSSTFYAPTVHLTISQASRFDGSANFYAATVSHGLTQSARAENTAAFYAPSVGHGLVQSARFDNSGAFYEATVQLTIGQSARFDNAAAFYAPSISLTLTQSSRFDGSTTFYAATVARDGELVQGARFDNSSAFYAATVTTGAVTLTADLFSDGDTFYAPSVGHGLTQASRFDGTASFYAPTVAHVAELHPSLVTNAAAFYAAEVMNQYPDPSSVLAGVVYGEPGLVFTGTYTAGFDGSLKLDVASGRMVKLLTNKVAITL